MDPITRRRPIDSRMRTNKISLMMSLSCLVLSHREHRLRMREINRTEAVAESSKNANGIDATSSYEGSAL